MQGEQTKTKDTGNAATDKLYMENTLLRVAGALFCHDPKFAAEHSDEISLNQGVAEKQITIRPDPQLGQPGPLAHKLFVALIKKHSNYGRPIRNEVSFSKREIMRLIGRSTWGGRDSQQLSRALQQIQFTFIKTHFKDGEIWREHTFNIFPEVMLERADDRDNAAIESCVVTLGRPIVASLQDEHFTCLNHTVMRELGTIGQALYMRLFFHFANLYDGHHKLRLTFRKSYADICAEWLGGLTVRDRLSHIERDQLGPHLRELVRLQFLASYRIDKAAGGDGFTIAFRPGVGFFADYERFYRHRKQGSVHVAFADDPEEIAEPLKVAYLFQERRFGQPASAVPYVASKEVETAKEMLKHVPFEGMSAFIGYALGEAQKTNFRVQTLGGLKQYLAGYREHRARQETIQRAKSAADIRGREQAAHEAYAAYRRHRAETIYDGLPAAERAIIDDLAQASSPGSPGAGSMADFMTKLARVRITAERHPATILSFEAWQARSIAASGE